MTRLAFLLLLVTGCSSAVSVPLEDASRYGEDALATTRSLAATVETIADATGNKGRQWAVEDRLAELGLEARVEWIDWWTPQKNVIVEVPGSIPDGPLVYVTAHYDKFDLRPDSTVSRLLGDVLEPLLSWSYASSGAVDNATGCAVALELAREVSRAPRSATYRFVFFGSEESGLRGSRCFVAGLSSRDVARTLLAVNLDCVGIRGEDNGVLEAPADPRALALAQEIALAKGYSLRTWPAPVFAASDHEPFARTSLIHDFTRGVIAGGLLGMLPQRSWFTKKKSMPVIAFASPGCIDASDYLAGIVLLPVGKIHGPRDSVEDVDAWRLYEAFDLVRELTRRIER